MSLARQFAAVGQSATAAFEEEDCKILRTNKTFRAKIVPIADIALNETIGKDPRATDTFYIRDTAMLRDINANEIVSALGSKFMLIPNKAPNNPASLHIEYDAVVGVPGKDDWA